MRQHACPRCGTPISYWGHQRNQSWRLRQISGPITCPGCGALLRWSIGPWERLQTAIMWVGVGFFTWVLFGGYPRDQRLWMIFSFCLAGGAVRIALELLATRLVDAAEQRD